MKRLVFGLAAVAAFIAAPALAADLLPSAPQPAPPPPQPASTWTGCYAGGNVGGGWTQQTQNRADVITPAGAVVASPVPDGSETDSGIVGGGQVGCDYQFATNWVIGVEGEFDWGNLSGSHPLPVFRNLL